MKNEIANAIYLEWNQIQDSYESSLESLARKAFDGIKQIVHDPESYDREDPSRPDLYANLFDLLVEAECVDEPPSVICSHSWETCYNQIFNNRDLDILFHALTASAKKEVNEIFDIWRHFSNSWNHSENEIEDFWYSHKSNYYTNRTPLNSLGRRREDGSLRPGIENKSIDIVESVLSN